MQAGDGRVGDERRLLGMHAVVRRHQRVADAHADHLGEATERKVDEAGEEPPEVVAADPQPEPLPVLQLEDRDRVAVEVVDTGLQELVPRVVVQDVEEHLRLVAVPRVGRAVQHGPDLPPDDRDVEQRLLRHVPRVKPEEPPLADRPASCVEPLDPDVVEIAAALHRRPGVGLRQVEQDGLEDLSPDVGRQRREPMRHRLPAGVPQDAEPRSRDRLQHLLLRARYELVLPVAEEREVVVGEPPQEVPGLSPVSGGDHRRLGVEVPGDRAGTLAHRRLVRVGGAHVAEDADQVETEPVEHGRVGLPVDLEVVEGLAGRCRPRRPRLVVEHGEQLALRDCARQRTRAGSQCAGRTRGV